MALFGNDTAQKETALTRGFPDRFVYFDAARRTVFYSAATAGV
jgi:hypothetical protein